jgi:fatty acid desaturase
MTVATVPASPRVSSDYSVLMAEVRRAKLLDRSPLSYLPRGLILALMTGLGLGLVLWLGHSWWQLAVAAYLSVVFAQLGFLGHDAGHQQIFNSRRWNDRTAMCVSNLGIGLSYRWWVDKHNRHHRAPNDISIDPDVQRNVLAWTADQAAEQRGVLRFVAKHQGAFFVPLLMFEAVNLQIGSVRVLLAHPKEGRVELLLLAVHIAICSAILFIVMSPLQALAFIGVQQALLGIYLGASFAPNHKGMPVFDGDSHADYLRRQTLTASNITSGRLLSLVLGNLNYQIEHHLFPSMPSHHLRSCQPIVKRFCESHDVAYSEQTLVHSYARVLRYLASVQPSAT